MNDHRMNVTFEELLKDVELLVSQTDHEEKLTDIKIPSSSTLKAISSTLDDIAETTGRILSYYTALLAKADMVTTDMEHLVPFAIYSKDEKKNISLYVKDGKLPLEVQDVPPEKYPDVLTDVLVIRRQIKDGVSAFKVINDKMSYTSQYIKNMDKRIYQCDSVYSPNNDKTETPANTQ